MKTQGLIEMIGETQVVSDKFKKREFVLTTDADTDYPQSVSFQVTQDKCDLLDDYKSGDLIDVEFNLRGRKWVNKEGGVKYFNTLEAWKIKSLNDNKDLPF